jgi:hypothetical protein
MKAGVIPFGWIAITRVLGARPNLLLLEEVQKRGIDVKDLPTVALVWDEMRQAAKVQARVLQERSAARALAAQADRLERETLAAAFPEVKGILKLGKDG